MPYSTCIKSAMVDRYSIHDIIAACMLCGGHRVNAQQGGREGGRKGEREGGRREGGSHTFRKAGRSLTEKTGISSMAPALALLTTGERQQLLCQETGEGTEETRLSHTRMHARTHARTHTHTHTTCRLSLVRDTSLYKHCVQECLPLPSSV